MGAARNADTEALRPEHSDQSRHALLIHGCRLCFDELNQPDGTATDVHGDTAHDDFQAVGAVELVAPAALQPKTRKPTALFGAFDVDTTTSSDVAMRAPFTASLLYRGDRVSEATGCASVTCAVIDDDTLSRFRHNVAPTSINQASEFRGCFSRPLSSPL
jgi:hypothetical protein